MTKIAIIGAGLAGITFARSLPDYVEKTLFEKSRGIGGRMATRYAGDFEFDHGAQYFTVNDPTFSRQIEEAQKSEHVRAWSADVACLNGARETNAKKYVASPRMNTLCKMLADGLDIRLKTQVAQIEKRGTHWQIHDTEETIHGPYDWVVSAAPAPQAHALLPATFASHNKLITVEMTGCFALMLGFEKEIHLPWPAARVADSPIGWIALNSAKPGRQAACSVLIHSTNQWAEKHLEDDRAEVQAALLSEGSKLTGVDLSQAGHTGLHRWRYAATPRPSLEPYLIDEANQLAACGDWCLGSKVEAAYTSGYALSRKLSDMI